MTVRMHIGVRARAYINIIYRSICDRHHMCRIQYYFADDWKKKRSARFPFSINVFVVRRHLFSVLNIKKTFSDRDVYRLSDLLARDDAQSFKGERR